MSPFFDDPIGFYLGGYELLSRAAAAIDGRHMFLAGALSWFAVERIVGPLREPSTKMAGVAVVLLVAGTVSVTAASFLAAEGAGLTFALPLSEMFGLSSAGGR